LRLFYIGGSVASKTVFGDRRFKRRTRSDHRRHSSRIDEKALGEWIDENVRKVLSEKEAIALCGETSCAGKVYFPWDRLTFVWILIYMGQRGSNTLYESLVRTISFNAGQISFNDGTHKRTDC